MKKGQIFIHDILIYVFMLLLIIVLFTYKFQSTIYEYKNIEEYKVLLNKKMYVEKLISDCNYFANYDIKTRTCEKNIINLEKINTLPLEKEICKIMLNNEVIYVKNNNKKINHIEKRLVIYDKKICILNVSFCEL